MGPGVAPYCCVLTCHHSSAGCWSAACWSSWWMSWWCSGGCGIAGDWVADGALQLWFQESVSVYLIWSGVTLVPIVVISMLC